MPLTTLGLIFGVIGLKFAPSRSAVSVRDWTIGLNSFVLTMRSKCSYQASRLRRVFFSPCQGPKSNSISIACYDVSKIAVHCWGSIDAIEPSLENALFEWSSTQNSSIRQRFWPRLIIHPQLKLNHSFKRATAQSAQLSSAIKLERQRELNPVWFAEGLRTPFLGGRNRSAPVRQSSARMLFSIRSHWGHPKSLSTDLDNPLVNVTNVLLV